MIKNHTFLFHPFIVIYLGVCLSEEDSQCPGIEEDYGGSWYCLPDAGLGNPVPSGTK